MKSFKQFSEALDKQHKLAIQKGDFGKKTAFSLRKEIEAIFKKRAKGNDWDIKKSSADIGLYYAGDDGAAAGTVARHVIADIYDIFQKGPRREVTRVKKTEDTAAGVTYTVMPERDLDDFSKPRPTPQITFSMNKQLTTDSRAVIAVNITPNWNN